MKKSFTLIELLVVVAIIGILAAVGTPIFQGFMVTSKINAAKENHVRAKDMISAYIAKCSVSGGYIQLKNNSKNMANVSCNSGAYNLALKFVEHLNSDGWKNPYDNNPCCYSTTNPSRNNGRTHIGGVNASYNTIYMSTKIGSETLTSSIILE